MTAPTRQDFRFVNRLRVRWSEVDMQKVVFNAHYLTYIDTAMTDYWRAMALPYEITMHAMGGEPFVRKATLEFHAPARIDDLLDVGLKCNRIGNSSMGFSAAIFRAETLLISSELVYVYANTVTQTSMPLPAPLREAMLGYEAWEPMVKLSVGNWQTLGESARHLRAEVFQQEQGIAQQVDWDDRDASAVHVVAHNRLGLPLGTGRLLQTAPGVGRIGRMAVKQVLRGSNVGRAVLGVLMQASAQRGDHEVVLHAQRTAQPFYARLGFQTRGEPFEEAGIVHLEMFHPLEAGFTPPTH
jgi:YbgC/YbaW family acyl-CoA thioester hydrolase